MKKLPLVLVLLLCFLTWWKLSLIPPKGDGLIYMISSYNNIYFSNFIKNLASFDWSAVVFGEILRRLFGTSYMFYGWIEVVFQLLTVFVFYKTVFLISKKNKVAFAASVILGVSFYGNWDMYAGGIYPWFLERVPIMLFLIPSFGFLHLFLEKKLIRYYRYSIILFFISIAIAHWGIFFTGPFVFYPIFWSIFNKRNQILKYTLISCVYILVVGFFFILQNLVNPGVGPSWGLLEFVLNPNKFNYFSDIVSQFVYWTTYLPFVKIALAGFNQSPITIFIKPESSLFFTPYVVVIYLLAFVITYIKLHKFRPLLITTGVSLVGIFFMNSYFGQYHISTQPGPNRYLYLPTYLFAIFWSLFLWAMFWLKKQKSFYIGHLTVLLFFVVNFWLVSENFKWNNESYQRSSILWKLADATAKKIQKGSTVIIQNSQFGLYESKFFTDEFLKKEITFISDIENLKLETTNTGQIFKIEYDSNCKCGKVFEWKKTLK